MRVLAFALAALALLVPSAAATPAGVKLLVREGGRLVLVSPSAGAQQVQSTNKGVLGFSGDGRLVSAGGEIVGLATLPGPQAVWAPTGERAATITRRGGVVVWTPAGLRTAAPANWGAQGIAWSRDGALAIGRAVCRVPCGYDKALSIWVWRDGKLRQRLAFRGHDLRPIPFAWTGDGRVLWWAWPDSGSVAADGVALHADRATLGTTLMYRDYVAVCGRHLAWTKGGDRYAMHGKSIVWDGRDVSRDASRSWVSPSCTAAGRLVAAASRNTVPPRLGREHRAIWQLLPARGQLTHPPAGWTDEDPHLLADGTLLFVRTRAYSVKTGSTWRDVQQGRVMLLEGGGAHEVAQIGFHQTGFGAQTFPLQYYGHYDWTHLLAVHR